MKNYILLFCFFYLCYPLHAQPAGTLDSTYNETGINQVHFDGYADIPQAICVGADGSIYTCVNISGPVEYPIGVVIKYHADGSIDNTFGAYGIANIEYADETLWVYGIMVQDDEKILVYGSYDSHAYICRLLSDGTPDTSFGTNGYVFMAYGPDRTWITCFTLQDDGKIVAAGEIKDDLNHGDCLVIRLNTDGTPDTSFGSIGYIRYDKYQEDYANAIVLTEGDEIIVGFTALTFAGGYFSASYIAKFQTDGSLDISFADDGVYAFPNPTGITDGTELTAVLLQSDEKIITVVNSFDDEGYSPPYIYRLTTDGSVDNSFGVDGVTYTYYGSVKTELRTCLLQPDDKILLSGGQSSDTNEGDKYLQRLLPDGAIDTSFHFDPSAFDPIGWEWAYDIALQPDDKIVITGATDPAAGSGGADLYTMRLLNDVNAPVAIENIAYQQFSMYPNPAADNIYIAASEIITRTEIFNTAGEKLYEEQTHTNAYQQNIEWLSSGIYIIRLTDENNHISTGMLQKL